MRFIGRLFSEASPAIFVVKFCPARIPESRRMVVPEFPASSERQLLFSPRRPLPVTRTKSFSTFTSAPSAFMQPSVLWQSAASAKLLISVLPSAIPASIA